MMASKGVGETSALLRPSVASNEDDEDPLTLRAILVGLAVGACVAAMNISFGLKAGWTQGGSVIAAVCSIALFQFLRVRSPHMKAFTAAEANICQTVASAAGMMASAGGFVSAIPALSMLGHDYSVGTLLAWAMSVGFIGIFFAVPLRKRLIVEEGLRFPSGLATYETIIAMLGSGDAQQAASKKPQDLQDPQDPQDAHERQTETNESPRSDSELATPPTAKHQATALLYCAVGAGAFTLLVYFIKEVETPPILENIGLKSVAEYGWALTLDPLLFGGGMLCGSRVGVSILAGAILAWGIMGPLVRHWGWTEGAILDGATGVKGWLLWPGVMLMVADALANLAMLSFPTIRSWIQLCWTPAAPSQDHGELVGPDIPDSDSGLAQGGYTPQSHAGAIPGAVPMTASAPPDHPEQVSVTVALVSLAGVTVCVTLVLWGWFGLALWQPVVAVFCGSFLAYIAVRCSGETDINPVGGVGKVSQLLFAVFAPGAIVTNLMAAMVVAAGASQAADMMHDFKTGYLLGASPRKQFYAQLIGIPFGVLVSAPIYKLFASAYVIGKDQAVPAPAAEAWRAVAEVLGDGFGALPVNTTWAILVAAIVGFCLPLARRILQQHGHEQAAKFIPSTTSVGIAFIIYAHQSFTIFMGAMALASWGVWRPDSCQLLGFSVASGLIAGGGLMGVVNAALSLANVPTVT